MLAKQMLPHAPCKVEGAKHSNLVMSQNVTNLEISVKRPHTTMSMLERGPCKVTRWGRFTVRNDTEQFVGTNSILVVYNLISKVKIRELMEAFDRDSGKNFKIHNCIGR